MRNSKKHIVAFLMVLILSLGSNMHLKAQLLDSLSLDTMQSFISLQEALKDPDKVIKLSLRKSKLKVFPVEVLKFKNLQYLDLSRNSLKEIPSEIDTLKNLQFLIISKNQLETLPKEIGKLKNLKYLIANQNELESLPPQLGNLENLEYLDLWSNNINAFPDQFKYLKKLKVVDLRVILMNDEEQAKIKETVPNAHIFFSPSCKCRY